MAERFRSPTLEDSSNSRAFLSPLGKAMFKRNICQMLRLNIALPSGKRKALEFDESSNVGDLKRLVHLVQKYFGQGLLRLVTAMGTVLLDPQQSLLAAGLQDGDHVTAVVQRAKLAATNRAFAMWCCGGDTVITWGHEDDGGDSSEVQDQFRSVQEIKATRAAILEDGSVVTWGDPDAGGDSSTVQDQLKKVQQIAATDRAFAAILADGSVVTWGDATEGGDSSTVQHQLNSVQKVQASSGAFAAVLADGSVVCWGYPGAGGDCSGYKI